MTTQTALKTTRTIALGTAALATYTSILLLGAVYTLVTIAIAVAYQAHQTAGYSPLLSNAPEIQSPQLLLSPTPRELLGTHSQESQTTYTKPIPTVPAYETPIITPAPLPETPQAETLRPLAHSTVAQLRTLASDLGGIAGAGKMKKAQLITHLEKLGYTHL